MSNETSEPIIPEVISTPPSPQQPDYQGLAIASLVLGILSLLTACLVVCAPLGIAGVVTGIFGLKSSRRDLAIAGMILSAVGIIASIVFIFGYGALISNVQNWNFNFGPEQLIP